MVMAGLVPAIHGFIFHYKNRACPALRPGMKLK
jgi:hypothetical protein